MGGINHCAGRPAQPPVKDPALVLKEFLPLELVFMPAWWHKHYGIKFDQSFYLDKETRIRNEQAMNQALYERYGEMRLGQADYGRRPILGSKHVAGGFVVPALMGCQIDFVEDRNLYTMGVRLTDEQAMQLEVPDPRTTWPMNQLLADMDELEAEFGYVEGDFDLDGAFNLAISLRGQHLFLDFRKAPAIARRLLDVCARALVAVAECVKSRTGTLIGMGLYSSFFDLSPRAKIRADCLPGRDNLERYLWPHLEILYGDRRHLVRRVAQA